MRLLAPGKPGNVVYATESRELKQYDVTSKRTKDIATIARVPDTITINYPPRKQYIYFKSGDNIIQVFVGEGSCYAEYIIYIIHYTLYIIYITCYEYIIHEYIVCGFLFYFPTLVFS